MQKTISKRKEKLWGIFTTIVLALLAFAVCIKMLGAARRENPKQSIERTTVSTALSSSGNAVMPMASVMGGVTLTLDKDTLRLQGNFGTIGWIWKLYFCEGEKETVYKIMTGQNHKEKQFMPSGAMHEIYLTEYVKSGDIVEGVLYSFAVYGSNVSGDDYKDSDVVTYTYRAPVALPPDPVKEGHTFAGWYYGESCNANGNTDGSKCVAYDKEPIYSDTALHAHFTVNKYTVTFDSNGGYDVNSQTVEWNTSVELTTPDRTGYTFLGWFLPNGTQYTDQPIKEDTTLTAHWEVIKFTVTFYVDNEVYKTLTVEYGVTLESVMTRANMIYYNLYDANGVKISRDSIVSQDIEVNAVAMTNTEKVDTFFTMYWWIIAIVVVAVVVLCVAGVYVFKRK